MIAVGHLFHPAQVFGVENDDYVGKAESILAGELSRDPFRPLLYPLLTAGLGWVLSDCFAAAKIVSSLFAGLFVGSGYLLARHCFGARVGLLTAALLICNGWVVTLGVMAATDIAFAGSSMLVLWLVARISDGASRGRIIALSAAFAMAYFSRYQASLLMLAVIPALWLAPEPGSGAELSFGIRLRRLSLFGLGAGVFLLPHFVLTAMVFGAPLHSENWRNIAIKHFGGLDFTKLFDQPFDGTLSVLLHDPERLLQQGWDELCRFLRFGYPGLLQGRGRANWFGLGLALLSLIGLLSVLRLRYRSQLGVFAYTVAYVLAVCMLFVPWPRITVAVLPVMYALIALVCCEVFRRTRLPNGLGWLAAILLLIGVAQSSALTFKQFQDSHPTAEIEAVEALTGRVRYPLNVLASYHHMQRYVSVDCQGLYAPRPGTDIDDYLQSVILRAEETHSEFVVLGRVGIVRSYFAKIPDRLPSRISIESQTEDVLVLRVAGVVLDWIERAEVSPNPYREGPLSLMIQLGPEADLAAVMRVLMVATGPSGERRLLFLQPGPGRTFTLVLDSPWFRRGLWTMTPVVLDTQDRRGIAHDILFDAR